MPSADGDQAGMSPNKVRDRRRSSVGTRGRRRSSVAGARPSVAVQKEAARVTRQDEEATG
jgi:hypothetical protein